MDRNDLLEGGWTHINHLGGPSGVYPAEWLLAELDNTQWWDEKDAIFVETVRRKWGLLPVEVVRLLQAACKACAVLDVHEDVAEDWTDYQKECVDQLHWRVVDFEETSGLTEAG